MRKTTILALGTSVTVMLLTAGSCQPPTHWAHCAKQDGTRTVKLEIDACEKGDDDYQKAARKYYIPNDNRATRYDDLGVGDTVPAGLGSFSRPTGAGVDIVEVADD